METAPVIPNTPAAPAPLLEVKELRTYFVTRASTRKAVDGVSFRIMPRHSLGLVGESGCGKSVTSLTILQLLPIPPGIVAGGEIVFKGRNLLDLTDRQMRSVRGNEISMIFQEPMTSLNPVYTVGDQVAESYRVHQKLSRKDAFAHAVEMLKKVRIPEAARRAREYPHQMSGGMRQRVMIAMALACNPDLLIADEPSTALDVTVQAQILALMKEIQESTGTSILLITHDLGVVAETCDEVAVMYAGQIVEHASTKALYEQPLHPYTQGLMRSIPRLEAIKLGQKLQPIYGQVPDPAAHPSGCRFHPRCPFATRQCVEQAPELAPARAGHEVRCLRWQEIAADPGRAAATADSAVHETISAG